jgi:hypothetical protein
VGSLFVGLAFPVVVEGDVGFNSVHGVLYFIEMKNNFK